MKVHFSVEKAEAPGFIDVAGIDIEAEVTAEESITFLKQILPIAREIKNLRLFEVEKDNTSLCNSLNMAREEKRDLDRELRQTKSATDLQTMKLKDELNDKNEKIRELEAQLKEATLKAKLNK